MITTPQRKLQLQTTRRAYRTLQGWALGTLIEQGVVTECEQHRHYLDRADPDAWNRAREEAERNPFPSATPDAALPHWKTSCAGSATPARNADNRLHFPRFYLYFWC